MSAHVVYVGNLVPITVEWLDYDERGFSTGFLAMSTIELDVYRPDGTSFSVAATASSASVATADSGLGNLSQEGRYKVHTRCTDGTYDFDLELRFFDVRAQP